VEVELVFKYLCKSTKKVHKKVPRDPLIPIFITFVLKDLIVKLNNVVFVEVRKRKKKLVVAEDAQLQLKFVLQQLVDKFSLMQKSEGIPWQLVDPSKVHCNYVSKFK